MQRSRFIIARFNDPLCAALPHSECLSPRLFSARILKKPLYMYMHLRISESANIPLNAVSSARKIDKSRARRLRRPAGKISRARFSSLVSFFFLFFFHFYFRCYLFLFFFHSCPRAMKFRIGRAFCRQLNRSYRPE